MLPKKKYNRRIFINSVITAGTAAAVITPLIPDLKPKTMDKVKMLTPDGKLVEVDQSVIEKATGSKKATNKEVFEWMDPKHKT
jgi:hypothetical protein